MAARLKPRHQDEIRLKIKSSQLVNALQNHVDGKNDLSQTQIRAAEILLKKSMPDLSAVEADVQGDVDIKITHRLLLNGS